MPPAKRKVAPTKEEPSEENGVKRLKQDPPDIRERFCLDICNPVVRRHRQFRYSEGEPFKHGILSNLVNDDLLRAVRQEIIEHVSFKPKETDIYRIYQSGDLANLDGLDDESLAKLPSLLKLRDALYSQTFRDFISEVSQCGALSGTKTDMAANLYTPGCHLLCHDDVIGSRRLSYILYLTDPDDEWQDAWGGRLRLYPTRTVTTKNLDMTIASGPEATPTTNISPIWNQMSFFAVQPGLSYHDVEEVYAHDPNADSKENIRRGRLAISGWFHVPQEGEVGYVDGLEREWIRLGDQEKNPKLVAIFERPFKRFLGYNDQYTTEAKGEGPGSDPEFTDDELEFLLMYIRPEYLTPSVVGQLNDMFVEDNALQLQDFLNDEWSSALREHLAVLMEYSTAHKSRAWEVARPPQKHRFRYRQTSLGSKTDPFIPKASRGKILDGLIRDLFPSIAFRKWLEIACDIKLRSHCVVGRHFVRGSDYVLGTPHTSRNMHLEVTLNLTPTEGWVDEDEAEYVDEDEGEGDAEGGPEDVEGADAPSENDGRIASGEDLQARAVEEPAEPSEQEEAEPDHLPAGDLSVQDRAIPSGGYETYMTLDEDDKSSGQNKQQQAGSDAHAQSQADDPAVYKSTDRDTDDSILHSIAPCWNVLSVVMRDRGSLRFVKYLSKSAPGDRYDVTGEYRVASDVSALGGYAEKLSEAEIERVLEQEAQEEKARDAKLELAITESQILLDNAGRFYNPFTGAEMTVAEFMRMAMEHGDNGFVVDSGSQASSSVGSLSEIYGYPSSSPVHAE